MARMSVLFATIVIALATGVQTSTPCTKQNFGQSSFVCVCSSTSCDTIDPVQTGESGTYLVYTSDKDNARFALENGTISPGIKSPSDNLSVYNKTTITITVNRNTTLQEILGFGGAFTDATGINVNKLSDDVQTKLLRSYFGSDGIEYNFGRVPMAATDFSLGPYSYADTADANTTDPKLEHFSLQQADAEYKIPLIKQARKINPNLHLIASPWTAPKWMKTNGQYTGGAIKEGFYQTWADYFVKFFDAYEQEEISFWGVTTGNEPSLALVDSTIISVRWLAAAMRKWVGENLGPTIRKSTHKDLKILTVDDQRFFMPWYPDQVMQNGTESYIDGFAVHWYWDLLLPASLLVMTHERFPDKILLNTESCRGDKFWEAAVSLGDWTRAEDYAHGIIEDLNNYVQGWVDWNLVLDPTGGPTYINNQVDALIIADATGDKFYKQPMYYAMGHFSKFIPRGSHKIGQDVSNRDIEVVAFQRQDGGVVVVVLNRKDTPQSIVINDAQSGHIELNLAPRSIKTILYW